MKANNGSGNNPSRDEWQTPDWIFDPLNEQYNFKLDCCASENNRKFNAFFSIDRPFEMGSFCMNEVAWMNPPFSKAWLMFERFFQVIKKGVAIYRADNFETGIWQKVIFPNASWVFIPDHRVSYEGLDGDGARFPSALIGYNVEPPKNIKGRLLRPEILEPNNQEHQAPTELSAP